MWCSHAMEYYSVVAKNEVLTGLDVNEFWKHYAKRKKPDVKDYISYDCICLKCSKEVDT